MTSGTIIGLLLGAGLTFAVQAGLQLFIVPRVETRKRREDRWEKDVLALGDLLTKDQPQVARYARSKQYNLHFMNSTLRHIEDVDLNRLEEALPETERKASEATGTYRELVEIQAEWLVERIAAISAQATKIVKFQLAWMRYRMASISCTLYDHRMLDYDDNKFKETWDAEHRLADNLRSIVKQLAVERHPPQRPIVYRVGRRIRTRFSRPQGSRSKS